MPTDRRRADADRELETAAAAVHQAYLDTCARLGWPVKASNQVPYEELPEDAKELDRASVRAVLDAVLPDHDARIRAEVAEEIATALENESGPREYDWGQYSNAAHIARAHATTEEPT